MANSFAFPEKTTIVGYVNKELEGKEGKLLRECFDKAGWGVSFALGRKVFIPSLHISSIYPCMRVSIIPFCSTIQDYIYIFFQSISFAPSPCAFFASELTHYHFAGVLFIDITTLLHYLKNLTLTETSSRSCDPLSRCP